MYTIVYHPFVEKYDLKRIPRSDQKRIFTAIEKKLMKGPFIFGKPLLGELKGYYRLRVGHYRVVYRIEKEKIIIFILQIGLRKDMLVYIEAAKRMKVI